ncbi:MAG: HEAT repeat domain-containing protein, partial [Anaerolineales bacterium]
PIIQNLHQKYPQLQIMISSSTHYISSLISLGFYPVWIVPWTSEDIQTLLQKWQTSWMNAYKLNQPSEREKLTLKNTWLLQTYHHLSPLEWILAIWLFYQDYPIYSNPISILDLGIQLLYGYSKSIDDVGALFLDKLLAEASQGRKSKSIEMQEVQNNLTKSPHKNPRKEITENSISQIHTILKCFAAAQVAINTKIPIDLLFDIHWSIGLQVYLVYSIENENGHNFHNQNSDILFSPLVTLASALKYLPPHSPQTKTIINVCVKLINNPDLALSLRAKLVNALASSSIAEVQSFFYYLLRATETSLLQLGVLGLSKLPSNTNIEPIINLIRHPNPRISFLACSTLAIKGNSKALDALTDALVNGDEKLRLAAANALALHPDQGHSILREGINQTDASLRKACVYGLARINQPWCQTILENLAIEEKQWMVKDAAISALELLKLSNPAVPKMFPKLESWKYLQELKANPLSENKGLNEDTNLLLFALTEGNTHQKLAAMEALCFYPASELSPYLGRFLSSKEYALREAAYLALWILSITKCP